MGIERDLHELLYAHDCVIVPQWGGFLTHYRPARLDEARKLIHPPGKDLSFNRHLVRNDGLLADRLAKREGLAFDAATKRIDSEVAGWRDALDRNGRLELERIGIFYRDAEQNLQFDPDRRSSYLKDAFGLRPLPAVPVGSVKPAPAIVPMAAEPQAVPVIAINADRSTTATKEPRRIAWLAAAVIGAVLLGGGSVIAYRMGSADAGQWSGIALFEARPAPSYRAPASASLVPVEVPGEFIVPEGEGVKALPLSPNDSVVLLVELGTAKAVADTTAVAMRPIAAELVDARFHVVGGCFAQPENAEKKLGELLAKGWPARRLPIRGSLHPVVFGSYATRADALAAMGQVRAKGDGAAWLLVR